MAPAQAQGTKTQQSNWCYCTHQILFLADDAFLVPSASTGCQEKIWAPSQHACEHQETPRHGASTGHHYNNQNGAIALTPYSFLVSCDDDAFLMPSTSTGRQEKIRAHSQHARKHQEAPRCVRAPGHNNQHSSLFDTILYYIFRDNFF